MEILKKYKQKLRYKRLAENTIRTYSWYVKEYLVLEKITDPYQVTTTQIISYLESRYYSSSSQQNQIISALKLFARYILGKKIKNLNKIERPNTQTKLQPVIPRPTIIETLNTIKNLKHKTIISVAYGCGLRVSELLNLKWQHIDRNENILTVFEGKGNKDRQIPISDAIINLLIEYYNIYKTKDYIFTGQNNKPQYSRGSCNALVKTFFGTKYRFHSLRKSFATHLNDLGTDLDKIRELLGHKKLETTRIYVSQSIEALRNVPNLV